MCCILSKLTATLATLSIFSHAVLGHPANNTTIYRDVAIIGGGACGTHASIRLSDAGLSTIIVESTSSLGGPARTYTDPESGTTIEYGVQAYQNVPTTVDFLDRLGLPGDNNSVPWGSFFNQTQYVDFTTGQTLTDFKPSEDIWSSNDYKDPLLQFPYLVWGKELPKPVPQELSQPFSDFIEKYQIGDVAFGLNSVWAGKDILSSPTLNVIGDTGLVDIANWQPGGSVRVIGGNEKVYTRAREIIGPQNILFDSTVSSASRSSKGVRLTVKTPTGSTTIVAKQLLVTIPTLADDMRPFRPDQQEKNIFQAFSAVSIWVAIIRIPGLPKGVSFVNANLSRPYNMTPVYGEYRLLPTAVDNLYTTYFNAETSATDEEAMEAGVESVTSLVQGVTGVQTLSEDMRPSIVSFSRVARWRPGMSADAIRKGTWAKMYALQGHRNTWYNGAMFMPASHQTWNYTETVLLPRMLQNAGK